MTICKREYQHYYETGHLDPYRKVRFWKKADRCESRGVKETEAISERHPDRFIHMTICQREAHYYRVHGTTNVGVNCASLAKRIPYENRSGLNFKRKLLKKLQRVFNKNLGKQTNSCLRTLLRHDCFERNLTHHSAYPPTNCLCRRSASGDRSSRRASHCFADGECGARGTEFHTQVKISSYIRIFDRLRQRITSKM